MVSLTVKHWLLNIRMSKANMKNRARKAKHKLKKALANTLLSYGNKQLHQLLESLDINYGDCLFVHSAWHSLNGYQGTPKEFLTTLLTHVGQQGLVIMPSMPYLGRSADYLDQKKIFNVLKTPSKMGILTELMRLTPDVKRSLNPSHPLIAYGDRASELLTGHERSLISFGEGSPFARLASFNTKFLCFDVSLNYITYTHYLESTLVDQLSFQLFEEQVRSVKMLDYDHHELIVKTKVLSAQSNRLRNEKVFFDFCKQHSIIKKQRLGLSKFAMVTAKDLMHCFQALPTTGQNYFK